MTEINSRIMADWTAGEASLFDDDGKLFARAEREEDESWTVYEARLGMVMGTVPAHLPERATQHLVTKLLVAVAEYDWVMDQGVPHD